MKESNHKFKEKPVGVDAHIDPHFKEITKKQNGITLIALIITIIVMMILVAVTVTFTVGENGILAQAKESAKLAERAQLHEQIMGAMKLTNEGKIIVGESHEAAERMLTMQGYTVGQLQADGTFEVIGKKGTYKYKITETEITIEENDNVDQINPVVGTYYYPGNIEAMTLNEDGTGEILGNAITYTCDSSTVSATMGGETQIFNYIVLEDNVLIFAGEALLAQNRNGIEGEEIAGQYRKDWGPSDNDECLTIDSETGTCIWEDCNFGSGLGKWTSYYYYYNNIIYNFNGEDFGLWTVNENGINGYVKE